MPQGDKHKGDEEGESLASQKPESLEDIPVQCEWCGVGVDGWSGWCGWCGVCVCGVDGVEDGWSGWCGVCVSVCGLGGDLQCNPFVGIDIERINYAL